MVEENKMNEFALNGSEYIELKSLIKVSGMSENGAKAKELISSGKVKVDGVTETRKACKIRSGQIIEYRGQQIKVV